jgi:hypothetical protein
MITRHKRLELPGVMSLRRGIRLLPATQYADAGKAAS